MDLYPAIDLRDGKSVRLTQGDFAAETIYADDPIAVARSYADAGAEWIHVVDLDGARSGTAGHREVIHDICRTVECSVQVGGGVRSRDAALELLGLGAARVVIGSAAVTDPDWVATLCSEASASVAIGLDARGADVAIHGWTDAGNADLLALAATWADAGAGALIVTEIGRDGTLAGPDLGQLGAVLAVAHVPVIASGGVGSLDDLAALRDLEIDARRLSGAIIGRSLAEGRFTLPDALRAVG